MTVWSAYGESGQAAIDAACDALSKMNRFLWYTVVMNVVCFNALAFWAVLR